MIRRLSLVVAITLGLTTGCSPYDDIAGIEGESGLRIRANAALGTKRGGPSSDNGNPLKPSELVEQFVAPYPNRENPFYRADLGKAVATSAKQSTSREEFIQLRGFVNVDVPRTVLAIGGTMASLAVGEQDQGIRIVAITPPSVTLESRGRTWVQTLLTEGSATLPSMNSTSLTKINSQ